MHHGTHGTRVSRQMNVGKHAAHRNFDGPGQRVRALALSLALASVLAVGPACADNGDSVPGEKVGRKVYSEHCSACHGADGRGGTPLGKLFRVAPPDLTRIAARRGGWFPEALVRELIDGRIAGHGERQMPVWGRVLTQPEMIAITEHLFSIQEPRLATGD